MATNLQVNASTQQAVGAFNALAQSIAAATAQFNNLNRAMASGNTMARNYSGQVTAINTAFNSLISILSSAFSAIQKIGAGVQFVFSSITKELDKLQGFNAIMSVTTKSADEVSQSYDFLRKMADKLGVQFDALTSNYAKLAASMPATEEGLLATRNAFTGIALAARTLHASNQDTQLMFYAITQMASKGAVSMEELRRQLGEKLPGVMQIAARALSTTPELLEKAIRTGTVNSAKFLEFFGSELIRTFQEPAEKASTSVSASINRLTNVWVDFVKQILDSGAGTAVANIFDAIREKLSDPYVIEQFAILVKELADRFTEFVKKLTQEDVRNGFDTLANGVTMVVNIVEKLVQLLQWIVNNGKTAGAIIGAIAGGAAGVVAGPWGVAVGAVAGAAGGAYAGSKLQSTPEQRASQGQAHTAAVEAARRRDGNEVQLKLDMLKVLGQFKKLEYASDTEKLWNAENLNTKTIEQLNMILQSKILKTDVQKAEALTNLARYGSILVPRGQLSDVVGGVGKTGSIKTSRNRGDALADDQMRAVGLEPKFYEHLGNYKKLLDTGKLDAQQYGDAVTKLVQKQPFAVELAKELRKEQELLSKETSDYITFVLRGVQAKERLNTTLDEELDKVRLLGPYAEAEAKLIQQVNDLKALGANVTGEEVNLLREKLRYLDEAQRVQSAAQHVLNSTVYRNRDTEILLQGMDAAGEFGASKQDLSNYAVQQSPQLFSGTEEYYALQRQQADDLIAYFDQLRQRNLISEQTYASLVMQQQVELSAQRLQNTSDFFGNLAALSKSGNSKIAAIGKAAAIAQATIDGVLAVQKALAAPPGWPFNAPQVIAVGISAAANVAQIAGVGGFRSGGYTGDMGRDQIAGVVHGQEYVVNASATARNRAELEAMNRGHSISSGSSVNVVIENYGSNKSFDVQQISREEVRIIARDEVVTMTPEIVTGQLHNANSKISRALQSNTTTSRRR